VPFLAKKCKIYPENPTLFGGIIGFFRLEILHFLAEFGARFGEKKRRFDKD
jgi:hypothetical protein